MLLARLILLLILTSCGNDPIFNDSNSTEVVDLFADDESLNNGESTVLRARFSFSDDDVFNDDNIVAVVFQIPNELRFRLGTAEIQASIGDDNDIGAQITDCPGGEQYLLFELDDNDLIDAEDPSGEAKAELTLTLDSANTSVGALVQAFASRDSAFFGCGLVFDGEDSEVIVIN